jgi:hypothetical protein
VPECVSLSVLQEQSLTPTITFRRALKATRTSKVLRDSTLSDCRNSMRRILSKFCFTLVPAAIFGLFNRAFETIEVGNQESTLKSGESTVAQKRRWSCSDQTFETEYENGC